MASYSVNKLYSCATTEAVVANATQVAGRGGRRRRRNIRDVASICPKWRPFPLSETGFVMSLVPRPQTTLLDSDVDKMTEHKECSEVAAVLDKVQLVDGNTEPNTPSLFMIFVAPVDYAGLASDDAEVVDESWRQSVEEQTTNRPLRAKKKWRVEKARRQLKTPHCRSVSNCVHGVTLYVNHRVLKRMTMAVQPTSHQPCSVTLRRIDKEKALLVTQNGRHLSVVRKPTPLIRQTSAAWSVEYDELLSRLLDSTSRPFYAVDTCNADR